MDPFEYPEAENDLGKDGSPHQITMMMGDLVVRDSLEGGSGNEIIDIDSVPTECRSEVPF